MMMWEPRTRAGRAGMLLRRRDMERQGRRQTKQYESSEATWALTESEMSSG